MTGSGRESGRRTRTSELSQRGQEGPITSCGSIRYPARPNKIPGNLSRCTPCSGKSYVKIVQKKDPGNDTQVARVARKYQTCGCRNSSGYAQHGRRQSNPEITYSSFLLDRRFYIMVMKDLKKNIFYSKLLILYELVIKLCKIVFY